MYEIFINNKYVLGRLGDSSKDFLEVNKIIVNYLSSKYNEEAHLIDSVELENNFSDIKVLNAISIALSLGKESLVVFNNEEPLPVEELHWIVFHKPDLDRGFIISRGAELLDIIDMMKKYFEECFTGNYLQLSEKIVEDCIEYSKYGSANNYLGIGYYDIITKPLGINIYYHGNEQINS